MDPAGQRRIVMGWCDWADAVLASAGPAVLVHGDLHGDLRGDNQVWDRDELRLVVDFETIGAGEPEYELRAFPGPGMGPGLELLTALMRHYQQLTGQQLSADQVMAWHLRRALGDVLWRSEAGLPLADHRTLPEWVEDLAARFGALGIHPEAITGLGTASGCNPAPRCAGYIGNVPTSSCYISDRHHDHGQFWAVFGPNWP